MRKAFVRFPLLFLSLLLFSLYTLGQERKDSVRIDFKKRQIGLYTGLGLAAIREPAYDGGIYNTGKMILFPNFSLVYQKNILPHFAVRTGIGYVRKGDHYRFYTGVGTQMTPTKVILHYLEVPVLVTLQSPRKFAPYINAGVSYGIALGKSQIKTRDPVADENNFRKSIGKEIYNYLDNALVASAGFKINGEQTDLFMEVQYSYSVTKVFYAISSNYVISYHIGFLFGK